MNPLPHSPSIWHEQRLAQIPSGHADAGKRLVETGRWKAPHHADMELTLQTIANCTDRSLAWMLHQFGYASCLIAHDRASATTDGAQFLQKLAGEWWARYKDGPYEKSSAPWHDHATGLRLQNLLLLRTHLRQNAMDHSWLDRICDFHAELLASKEFYNANNNHGLDQSIALFEYAGEMRDVRNTANHAKLAASRIAHEIGRAFAEDGGHIENSAAYQSYGINQAQHAADIGVAYTGKPIGLSPERHEQARRALAFMTRPDGKLVLVGDTVDFRARRQPAPDDDELVLRRSGWAMFRSDWTTQAHHLVFRCGHLSNFHRHDDDLSISLFAFGEEWIIDGGQYKHEPTDPFRIYMRSADAHSLPAPTGRRAVRDLERLGPGSLIVSASRDGDKSIVCGESLMFNGFRMSREVIFDRADRSITLRDRGEALSSEAKEALQVRLDRDHSTFLTRFLVPTGKRVLRLENGGVEICGKRQRRLRIETRLPARIVTGQKPPRTIGWRSTLVNKVEEATDITFLSRDAVFDETFRLSWVLPGPPPETEKVEPNPS
jgi:hypothetical protein